MFVFEFCISRGISQTSGDRVMPCPEVPVRAQGPVSRCPARKAFISSTVPKNGEVYTPETSCMKGTSVHIKIT